LLERWGGEIKVRAYFYAESHNPVPHKRGPGVIAFSVPDLGFIYRVALRATPSEFPYRALLALINFLESNRKVWHRQKLELCTDCAPLIYQVLGDMAAPAKVRQDLGTVRVKKRRLNFTLHWVSAQDNRARHNVVSQPVAQPVPQLNFSSLQDHTMVQRAQSWKQRPVSNTRPKL
jgi:hypothetical protein